MTRIHINSVISHHEHEDSGKGASYRKKIIALLKESSVPMTDRQIQDCLNVEEKSNIQPEVTRLKQSGVLEECGRIKCPVTGKTVRVVQISKPKEYTQPTFF